MRRSLGPLLLLGTLGMCLSETLSWNISTFALALLRGPARACVLVLATLLMYIGLFALAADQAMRRKVRDLRGLLLLGSVYGLLLEGVFAHKVFEPPAWLGINPLNTWFVALSWHPLIDFAGAFFLTRHIRSGRLRLDRGNVLACAALGAFWYVWSQPLWVRTRFPDGIPAPLMIAWMLLAFILVGLAASWGASAGPGETLAPAARTTLYCLLALACAAKLCLMPNKPAFLSFCLLLAFCHGLFLLDLRARTEVPERSIYEEALAGEGDFRWKTYSGLCAVTAGTFFLLHGLCLALGLRPWAGALGMSLALAMMIACAAFIVRVLVGLRDTGPGPCPGARP